MGLPGLGWSPAGGDRQVPAGRVRARCGRGGWGPAASSAVSLRREPSQMAQNRKSGSFVQAGWTQTLDFLLWEVAYSPQQGRWPRGAVRKGFTPLGGGDSWHNPNRSVPKQEATQAGQQLWAAWLGPGAMWTAWGEGLPMPDLWGPEVAISLATGLLASASPAMGLAFLALSGPLGGFCACQGQYPEGQVTQHRSVPERIPRRPASTW